MTWYDILSVMELSAPDIQDAADYRNYTMRADFEQLALGTKKAFDIYTKSILFQI